MRADQNFPSMRGASQPPAFLQLQCEANLSNLHLQIDTALHAPWTVLFGPSGAGKSSLLRLIAGLWTPHNSHLSLHGRDLTRLPPHRRRIGFVSQSPALFPHLSVLQNMSFGLPKHADSQQTSNLLDRFGITHLADARVHTLSGGEAQRVAIARAILPQPDLLLLDESFSGLHRDLRTEFLQLLRTMQAERPKDRPMPILSITHDIGEAFACADEVLRIEDGRILAQGPANVVLSAERDALLQQFSAASMNEN